MSKALDLWKENRWPSLFKESFGLQESIDRLFNEILSLKKHNGEEFSFTPSCEVTESEKSYIMKFDLPGVDKDKVKVEVENDQLTIRAERKEERKEEDKKKFLSEIFYGTYYRTFTLPGPVDEKKIEAKFENGVLTVIVPKTEAQKQKTKQIEIH